MRKVLIVAILNRLAAANELARVLRAMGCHVDILALATVSELLSEMSATVGSCETVVVLFDVPMLDDISAEAVRLAKDNGVRVVGVRLTSARSSDNPKELEKYGSASVNFDEQQIRRAIDDGENIWLDLNGSERVGPDTERNKCKPKKPKSKPKAA